MNSAILLFNDITAKLAKTLLGKENKLFFVEQNSQLWGDAAVGENICKCVSSGKAVCLYKKGEIDRFIIPSDDEYINNSMYNMLKHLGVKNENIFYASVETMLLNDSNTEMITLYTDRRELDTIELHVAEHCNLNCSICSMFCPLVDKKDFPKYDSYEKDLVQLKKFFNHIKRVRVIGGEPLLNKELYKYFYKIRELFPYTEIKLITNGILLMEMPEILKKALIDNNVNVDISYYKINMDKIDEISAFLNKNKIHHSVGPLLIEFQKMYNLKGNSNIKYVYDRCCWKSGCATMMRGKMAVCFVPFVLPFAFEKFNINAEISGLIDLYEENLTLKDIRKKLENPFDLCRFCADKIEFEDWHICNKKDLNNPKKWSI